MWEDAFSQWVYDPTDRNDSFILLGAINGDNGDRKTDGRGQKIYIAEWDPDADPKGSKAPVCDYYTVF